MKMKENDKMTIKMNIAVSILLVVVLSFISVGYALYGQSLNLRGNLSLKTQGKIAITDVTLVSSVNVKDGSIPAHSDDSIDFNLSFEKGEDATSDYYQAVYSITIENGTFYDFDFNLANYQPVIKNSSGETVDPNYLSYELSGIQLGDTIPALESVTFTLTLNFNPEVDDTYTVDGAMETDLEEQPHGSLLGSIPANFQGDLRESNNSNLVPVTVTVINSYHLPKTFTINITDTSHFALVDSNGSSLGSYIINGGATQDYTVYIKRADGAKYLTDSLSINIVLNSDGVNTDCGSAVLFVDKEEEDDLTPPIISNVTVTINDATSADTSDEKVGSVTLDWNGVDNESGVMRYFIKAYKGPSGSETFYNDYQTNNANPQITIDGLEDGNYYFKVYGENNKEHIPDSSQIDNCNNSYCDVSSNTKFTWHYSVGLTDDSSNIKSIEPTKVNRGKTLNATITAKDAELSTCGSTTYTLSDSVDVYMAENKINKGNTAGTFQFQLSSNKITGTLVVYGVTGNITVKASATSS